MMQRLFEILKMDVKYAKTTLFPIRNLYQVLGSVKMAYRLDAITQEEYLELDHSIVYEGINNPIYFNKA